MISEPSFIEALLLMCCFGIVFLIAFVIMGIVSWLAEHAPIFLLYILIGILIVGLWDPIGIDMMNYFLEKIRGV